MPRPAPTPADGARGSSAQRIALVAALLTCALALLLAAAGLVALAATEPGSTLPSLLAVGMACAGASIGWTLWRQRALEGALHDARAEAAAAGELVDGWRWRTDPAHHLTLSCPAAGDGSEAPHKELGRTPWAVFDADDDAAAALRCRMEAGLPLDGLPVWRRTASGERARFALDARALLDSAGEPAGYLGSARRCRDDKQVTLAADERRLEDQRLVFTAMDELAQPVFILGAAPRMVGDVVFANCAAARLLGTEAAALAGLAWPDLRTRLPEGVGGEAARLFGDAAAAAPKSHPAWDVRARRVEPGAGSQPFWVLSLAPGAAAKPATSDHESFSYTVSHDLRAPIRVVEGFTKILKEDYGHQLDRIGNDHLDRVLGAAARMNSMIDALLTLSQLSSRPLARQPVNLSQLAGYVADDLRRQSPEREVDVRIDEGLLAQGDPTLLRVVLENLLGNAWKYTSKKPDARIWFERGVHDGRPAFCVRDNGAGFDMRFVDRLFGVFQRLHSANDFQGTGVGLASVQRIVRRHGGEIWADSELQGGSRFFFSLPSGTASK